ncbi:lytic transglycosylase domain-containing protein [Celeribacter halophilus]|uniref:lytic transglycosylase domain-containing protein n=1 Tax=Celeribacter halophilus TaxID=576117 RepID=UPI001C0A5438|nr:lytic transglycosylase domain-containing protein [Celeribacter halophilus]MBU2889996.1 lytic transglycosylase domain-containing protein [Celeribacter halophilus]MDO6511391.1 lytic transglycosylase domain-containing protein [Celeribacter halophilus]
MPLTFSTKAVYAFVFVLLLPFSLAASSESDALRRAYEARAQGDWSQALNEAQGVGRDIIEWHYLRAGRGTFEAYRDFLNRNADWPGLPLLAEKGEASIPADASAQAVLDYLTAYPPQTGQGALRLIGAYEDLGKTADAQAQAVLIWNTLPMKAEEEAILLGRYGSILKRHHVARAEMLLWAGRFDDAERMLPNLPTGWDKLITATRKLVRDEAGVDDAISAVPATLADHPVLAHARFEWRVKRGRNEDATTLLLQHSTAEGLGEAEAWGNRRRTLARQMMRDGKAKIAYAVAARHGLAPDEDHYADLEWLAGYIALRYLDDAGLALDHFNRFRMAVGTPISLGRAGYWEGRALEAMGARDDAAAAYAFGAQFQTSFYGLLSAEKIGRSLDPALTGEMRFADYKEAGFMNSSVLKAALLLEEAGDKPLAARFLRHLGESLNPQELGQLGDLALDLDPYLAVLVAKFAADQGIVLNRAYYPLHELAQADLPVKPELALAIARRESEFYDKARSHVGARGLMQLMPRTGAAMAEKLGVEGFEERQLEDPVLNARLGSAYLAQLIEEFGYNIPLVAVGYNAGPSRARDWIERYGDPRTGEVDPVDWIEHLPFRETRNYVMRVAESLPVYRARLQGEAGSVHLMELLTGR